MLWGHMALSCLGSSCLLVTDVTLNKTQALCAYLLRFELYQFEVEAHEKINLHLKSLTPWMGVV